MLLSLTKNGVRILLRALLLTCPRHIFDLYDRYPVGYAISKHNDTASVQSAYEQAIKAYPNAYPLFHSDRGFQFTRAPFQNQLKKQGMIQSMSRVGCCIDNGPMEGWQGLIKEMRKEALKGNIKSCPIAPNHRIERYWQKIYEKKIKEAKKVLN